MQEQMVNKLVAAWFAGDPEGEVYDACRDLPETIWQVVLKALKHNLTDEQQALLAAGPLEDLLVLHGAAFIGRVEDEAKVNPAFNHLLGGVWRREMPTEIWLRIERARKEVW
jgi:hypothetical protein